MSIQLFCQFLNQVVHVFKILIDILLDLYLTISFLSFFFFGANVNGIELT